jgi:hypothetical protein
MNAETAANHVVSVKVMMGTLFSSLVFARKKNFEKKVKGFLMDLLWIFEELGWTRVKPTELLYRMTCFMLHVQLGL